MTPRQLAFRSLATVIAVIVVAYIVDFIVLQVRKIHPTATVPYESLTRTRVLAIPQKSGKTEYQIDAERPTETLTCVHALFPHSGFPPCWRLKPHINDPIPMTILAPLNFPSPHPALSSPHS